MAKPPRDPPVADREPSTDVLPFYDDDHCVVYLRLLDAGCRVSRPYRQGSPQPRNGPSDRPKPRLRQGAIIQPDIFTISRANRSWYPSPPRIALAQQAQKPPESRIVVGSPPIGDIVDQDWFVVAIDLAVDDPQVRSSGPAFVQQADALSGAHHAQDIFAADVVAQDGWLVPSGDVGDEDVVDFRSRILAGQQEAFPLEVLPVDPRMRSERVLLRHRDHDCGLVALASSWAMLERLLSAAGEPQRAGVASQHLSKLKELPPAIVEAGSWFCDGEHVAAENLLTSYIAREGRQVEALRLLGRIAQRRGAADQAEGLFREGVDSAPGYAAARLDFVRVLIESQKYAAALEQVDQRLRTAPSDPEARFLRATIHAGLGRHDDAVPIFRELLSETPQRNHLRIVLGHSLKALGRTDEAVRAYRDATSGEADIGDAFWSLANLKAYHFSDHEVERMRGLEALPSPGLPDRAHLCFALGKALEDRADYGGSWAFYERGNSLVRAKSGCRPEAIEDNTRRLIEICSEEFFVARTGAGAAARDPIYIVGLPRSGSTLLEQILASHPDVDGTQELQDIPRIVSELQGQGPNRGGACYPDLLPGLDPLLFEPLGRRYLDETRVYRRGRPRFVDKMPDNFWHIGLVHLMLPNARIIDIRREPMACCVSNLKPLFATGPEFCYGIEEIARYD